MAISSFIPLLLLICSIFHTNEAKIRMQKGEMTVLHPEFGNSKVSVNLKTEPRSIDYDVHSNIDAKDVIVSN
jgi:hypothetical protein